jgi:hypothetical protein
MCDQETPKREAKGSSWTISACELMNKTYFECGVSLDVAKYAVRNYDQCNYVTTSIVMCFDVSYLLRC